MDRYNGEGTQGRRATFQKMVMTDAAGDAAFVHTRMPVILNPGDYDTWQNGAPEDAKALVSIVFFLSDLLSRSVLIAGTSVITNIKA